MEKICLILPHRKHIEDLLSCLKSINAVIDPKKYEVEVILVDDHSDKYIREEIINNFCKFNLKNIKVKPKFLSKTLGFNKACNIGIKAVLARKTLPTYIGIIHDDIKVFSNWMEKLLEGFETDISTWCVASMSTCERDLHSIKNLAEELNVLQLTTEAYEKTGYSDDDISTFLGPKKPINVDKTQIFSALFKTEVFKEIGLFEEDNLTSINLEYDYFKKFKEGKTIKIAPGACVYHKARLTSGDPPLQLTYDKLLNVTEKIQKIQHDLTGERKPYVVYTFVKDGDNMPNLSKFEENVEYVCFTTNNIYLNNSSNYFPWKLYNVNDFDEFLEIKKNSKKMKEFIKLNPHLFFKNYDISIWMDPIYSNIYYPENDSSSVIQKTIRLMDKDNFILCGDTPDFSCSYMYLINLKKNSYMNSTEFDSIMQIYKWVNYPLNNKVADTSILIRKHNDERCKEVMNKIWNFTYNTYADDQLFFNFVMWYYKYNYSYVPSYVLQKTTFMFK